MKAPAASLPTARHTLRLTPALGVAAGVFILLFALLGLLVWQLVRSTDAPLVPGQPVPDFVLETFDGERLALADWRGRGVVLNFWASWCHPCREEAALLEATWRAERESVMFVGIAYLDQRPAALRYLEEFDITYPNGRDRGSAIADSYGMQGVPATYFIDPDGHLVHIQIGPFQDASELAPWLDQIRP